MTFKFGNKSLTNAKHVDPALMAVATAALARSPVDFGMTENQSRTLAEQQKKVDQGVSKTLKSRHIIQPDGFSKALDLVPWIDGAFTWGKGQWWQVKTAAGETLEPFFDIADAMRAEAVAQGVEIRWGAVWDRRLNDLPAGPANLKAEMKAYITRIKAKGVKNPLIDGPHYELPS